MNKKRITSISRIIYNELWKNIENGKLLKEWPQDRKPITKKEKTLSRQLGAIAFIEKNANKKSIEILKSDKWTELHILTDGKNIYLEIEKRS